MKQNKKQSWIKRNNWFWGRVLIIGIFLIVIWGIFAFSKTDKYFCSKNPDKCVCEGTKYKGCVNSPVGVMPCLTNPEKYDPCVKFHKKTQAELNIDDCNNNPREDDKCRCEKEIHNERLMGIFNRVRLQEKNISLEDYKYITYLYMDNFRIECRNNIEDCFTYEILEETHCLKSRPKTE